jgi:hypothetical protein
MCWRWCSNRLPRLVRIWRPRSGWRHLEVHLQIDRRQCPVKKVWSRFCTHIACFSATGESSDQWKSYAKCEGFALGFDRLALQNWCLEIGVALFPVVYCASKQRELIQDFLDKEKHLEVVRNLDLKTVDAVRSKAMTYLTSLAMPLKSAEWQAEQEWRLLIIQPLDQRRFAPRTRGEGICYFELPLVVPELLKEVVVAKKCKEEFDSIRSHLAKSGLADVEVRRTDSDCANESLLMRT